MTGYSYVLETDSGFAPNPFGGFCSLAGCKPVIRRTASVGDWVLGFGSAEKKMQNRLIYAMRVDEVVTIQEYWDSPRFQVKKPIFEGTFEQRCGDNIYFRDELGAWVQLEGSHCEDDITTDISGKNVLISHYFWYFGKKSLLVPDELRGVVKKGRGHMKVTDTQLSPVINWLVSTRTRGVHGEPIDFNRLRFPVKG